ncbi:MAG TPA: T9SS type A sorting domain-containing protein [Flavipsychrobacter sp.]|nr:T9SS type A sorting domain-containing protein [Flavipsychrobacter sp.]
MIVLLFSFQTYGQPIPATNPETTIAGLTLQAWPFFNLEDVVINCDMLQLGTDDDAQDYNTASGIDVISRAIDVSTGVVGVEYVVNQTATTNMWDVNRIYAVSNSSNSGKNILSALYNGTDIVYKVSANSASYKQGNTTGIIHNPGKASVRLYPNPAHHILTIAGADNSAYEIQDMTGKLMLKGYNKGSSIDIRTLPAGMYIISLQEENKTLKFTKQ